MLQSLFRECGKYFKIKGKIYQKVVVIIYVPNNLTSRHIKQEWMKNKKKFMNQYRGRRAIAIYSLSNTVNKRCGKTICIMFLKLKLLPNGQLSSMPDSKLVSKRFSSITKTKAAEHLTIFLP